MASENLRSGFQRGAMAMIILSLLKQEDMYGYQMVQEIEKRSGGVLLTQEGSMYPVLYKLEDKGCVTSRRVVVGRRLARMYYHIEEPGFAYLDELVQEYKKIENGIHQIIDG